MHSFRARVHGCVRLNNDGCATGRVSAPAVRRGCHHCVMRPLVGSDRVFNRRALRQLCKPSLTLLRYRVRQTDHRIHLGIQGIQHLRAPARQYCTQGMQRLPSSRYNEVLRNVCNSDFGIRIALSEIQNQSLPISSAPFLLMTKEEGSQVGWDANPGRRGGCTFFCP